MCRFRRLREVLFSPHKTALSLASIGAARLAKTLDLVNVAGLDAVLVAGELTLEHAGPSGMFSAEHLDGQRTRAANGASEAGERSNGAGCADQARGGDGVLHRLLRIQADQGYAD
jgi:hypothetical protein